MLGNGTTVRGIAISTGSAGAGGLVIGVLGANTDAANNIIDAIVNLIQRLDPTVALISLMFFGVGAACWLRSGQFRADIAKQYGALAGLRDFAIENRGQNHRIMDRLGIVVREVDEPVEHERRLT